MTDFFSFFNRLLVLLRKSIISFSETDNGMTLQLKKICTKENLVYLIAWIIIFLMPILTLWVRTITDDVLFNWAEVFRFWSIILGYLIAFLIHNSLIAPILVYKKNKVRFYIAEVIFVSAFIFYKCSEDPRPPIKPLIERHITEDEQLNPPLTPQEEKEMVMEEQTLIEEAQRPLIDMRNISALAVLIFAIGSNVGLKLYHKTRIEQEERQELEKENLTQELAYLRYQINPHFFMNTLNNIHALVDIDPEQAKTTIVELSKMMRYLLYESDSHRIPLAKEMAFIKNYVALMRLRYSEKVTINLRATPLPMVPDVYVTPLLMVPIIENAFKHGVSYQETSFIDVNTVLHDDHIVFTCHNTKHKCGPTTDVEEGGVGLKNVKKRLELIYGDKAQMTIHDNTDTYEIELIIPVERTNPETS